MSLRKEISKVLSEHFSDNKSYRAIDSELFMDKLLDLATLDLEDGQVNYPYTEDREKSYIMGGNSYDLYILDRDDIPSSGPFEILITDDDEEVIGFIRGTKRGNVVSFNLIHISEEHRGSGIGTDIYEKMLDSGYIIKSDKEITDSTYGMYDRLLNSGYKPLLFGDMTVGLAK